MFTGTISPMTDSMIERVAREIEHVIREFPDNSPMMVAKIAATVAVTAMREPTDYMKAAWSLEVRDPAWCLHDWQSAIDAALNEKAGR